MFQYVRRRLQQQDFVYKYVKAHKTCLSKEDLSGTACVKQQSDRIVLSACIFLVVHGSIEWSASAQSVTQ